jgi:large conductance mechanosensitive channel
MKNLLKEFKAFAVKGNVIDLATAVIIGGAFGKIVSSLVADIIMPLIGLISGGGSFSNWKILLRPELINENGDIIRTALNLNAGIFVQHIIDFIIISTSVFLMIKALIAIKKQFNKEEEKIEAIEKEKTPSPEEKLLTEIRDILKKEAN